MYLTTLVADGRLDHPAAYLMIGVALLMLAAGIIGAALGGGRK